MVKIAEINYGIIILIEYKTRSASHHWIDISSISVLISFEIGHSG